MSESNMSDFVYAAYSKEILHIVNQLRALGTQADFDLPRIVVIGNQNAGKSSLVEAISRITVPRDAGTCTRCPFECRLFSSDDDAWSCRVSIRREFDQAGSPLEAIVEESFGNPVSKTTHLESLLRRAQLAVLNPSIPHSEILDMSEKEVTKLACGTSSFGKNIVCVDVRGPELPNLSFMDLPGLIHNAHSSGAQLIEDMVVSQIKGNCLILVALSMTDDIQNQKALRLAQQADPHGLRTIGVMTKPDMIVSGDGKSLDIWMQVIQGQREPLYLGYYCTRQPTDTERGSATPVKAREREERFFATTAPFCDMSDHSRFGINTLTAALSNLLVDLISQTLPTIRSQALDRLDLCRRELRSLPKPIEMEPAAHMLHFVMQFTNRVQQVVEGKPSDFIQENNKAYAALKLDIRSSAPNFIPCPHTVEKFEVADDEDHGVASQATPCNLMDIRKHIAESVTRELPQTIPFQAKVSLIREFQRTWPSAVGACLQRVRLNATDVLIKLVDDMFPHYDTLRLFLRNAVYGLIEKHLRLCSLLLDTMIEAETTPFTQNTHYLDKCTDKWLAKYKDYRTPKYSATAGSFPLSEQMPVWPGPLSENKIPIALAALAELGYTGLTVEDLGKLNRPDEFETELKLMAEVRAYFQVAYKRVIDCGPSYIDLKFVKAISKDLQSSLIADLGLGTSEANEICARYLAEDPRIAERREELQAYEKQLLIVQQELINLG